MARKNKKKQIIDYESSIKKSNKFSMAKLSQGFTLNQMQLLAYAIYCTQKNEETSFHKADFEKKFGLEEYRTVYIKEDIEFFDKALVSLINIVNLEEEFIKKKSIKVFREIEYNKGLFSFKWDGELLPHIIDLKEKFVLTDLTITSKFNSGFSWILYDFLRGLYGAWHKQIAKESLMELFNVENVKTYQKNTGRFKQAVLDVAIAEINQYTELEVNYDEIKKGRSIVGFKLKWSTGIKQKSATSNQINTLKITVDTIIQDSLVFIDLNNEKNRQRAIKIVKETRDMIPFTGKTVGITYEKADELIQKANDNLRELNNMFKKEKGRDISLYYNWLEDEKDK